MQKLTLPLVMIATLSTLVSCGQRDSITRNPTSIDTPVLTGVVETHTTSTSSITPLIRTETLSYDSRSPEGMVPVEFSVTVNNGIITAASVIPKTDKEVSHQFQVAFAADIANKAIGKRATDLSLDAVGGASLTTAAFETFVHSF